MDWNKGFSAKYYARILDRIAWRETKQIELVGGSVTRSNIDLRQNSELSCVDFNPDTELWIRVWLDVRQGNDSAHIPLFTGLTSSPDRDYDGNLQTNSIQCYSVLQPLQDIFLPRGWYAPAGASASTLLKVLMSVTPAPVSFVGVTPQLKNNIIAEDDETNLTMADKILKAINWRLKIDGSGHIQVCEQAISPVAVIDPINNDVIEPQVKVKKDWYSCPNVFRAIDEDEEVVVKDNNLNSPLSIVNRGREIWAQETSCDLNLGENLTDYARRRLKELQQTAFTVSYSRRFIPDVFPADIVRLNYPQQQVTGNFGIVSQKIELGYGARTEEEVVQL